jgi:DNA-binding transcriptional LysR family regulator
MDRLHLMSVFVAVAEAEGFASGARKLGMSPPAVTRAVATLEQRLGVRLLSRTTRFVRVTEAGARYLEDARRVIAQADEADGTAAGLNATPPRGNLAITAPVIFGRMYVTPVVVEFLRLYPATKVSALLLDRPVNLVEEGLDVGIRIGELPDSTMRAIPAGRVRRVVCASPKYLKSSGVPAAPADLAKHCVISASAVSPSNEWKFASSSKPISVKIEPRLTLTSNDAAIEAAIAGLGLTRLFSYQIAPYLASRQLKSVLSDYEPPPLPIHVLHREGQQSSPKVRAFVDLMTKRLRAQRALN